MVLLIGSFAIEITPNGRTVDGSIFCYKGEVIVFSTLYTESAFCSEKENVYSLRGHSLNDVTVLGEGPMIL